MSPLKWEPVGVLELWTWDQFGWVPGSPPTNYSSIPVPSWWREESWKWGLLVVDTQCHIRGLKDPWGIALLWLVSPPPPRALQDLPPIPSHTNPPSTCGSYPFTLGPALISKISFCFIHFGPFVNDPPAPEIFLSKSVIFWNIAMSTEWLGISHSMPQAGTPPGLPGRKGVFGCWCKWTSFLEVPRLRSHYSTVFCPALPPQLTDQIPSIY